MSSRWTSFLTGRHATVVVAVALMVCAPIVSADGPVSVTFETSGNAVPGGTVQVTATLEIGDGSSLQSLAWSQESGAPATLSGADTATVTAQLASMGGFREYLIHVLSEPPIGAAQLPPTVPVPPGEFPGGLQNRFTVVGMSPFSLEHAAAVALELEITTSSGTYHAEAEIDVPLPWRPAGSILNVPIGLPVVLHGKTQTAYNWALAKPNGSASALVDPSTQNPEFTPDLAGNYRVTVTDEATGSPVTLSIYAGTWRGVIVGAGRQRASRGRPGLHQLPQRHLRRGGLPRVGQDRPRRDLHQQRQQPQRPLQHQLPVAATPSATSPASANDGIDDNADWQAFLDSGLLTHGDPENWNHILDQFPDIAKQANIQCENCHGPQNSQRPLVGRGARDPFLGHVRRLPRRAACATAASSSGS